MSKVKVEGLNFSYNLKRMILKNINLDIKKGEWVAVLGHNGSGKSTLAKVIVGLLEPQDGHVYIDDLLLSEETSYEIRKKIGIVFQNPDNQFVGVTVKDDIAFGMENLCFSREEMLQAIDFFAHKVGVDTFLDKEPATLSGGQKQRVAIAGILAMQTQIIIFDEATSMLDPFAREDLMKYIKKLHEDGLTIIMITHDIEEALLADRMIVLKDGAIFLDGTREEVLNQPDKILEANLALPISLQLANQLDQETMQAWKETLWAYTLEK